MRWRHQYDELGDAMSEDTAIDFSESVDKTVQSGKDDADINVMLRRFGVTGKLPSVSAEPFYGDFSEVEDYRTALERVREADHAFAGLSAEVRTKFENDPGKLWDYLHNPDIDVAEARQLGLLVPEEVVPPPMRVEVINPVVPPEA